MNKNLFKLAALLISTTIIFSSCKEDQPKPETIYENGMYVVCEGNFGSNDGTISFIGDTTNIENLFEHVNSRPLGDVVQSMTIIGDRAYIVVNNSQKIEVVDSKTFKSKGTIKGLSYPRSVTNLNDDKILVTNGNGTNNDDYVYVISKSSLTKIDSLVAEKGPEKVCVLNNKIFVINSGSWTNGNTVSIFDATTLNKITTKTIGDIPVEFKVDESNNILIFCKGIYNWTDYTSTTNAKIVRINSTTNEVTTICELDHANSSYISANMFEYNNGTMYFIDDAVYTLTEAAPTPVKLIDGYFYGIDINPTTNDIWVTRTSSISQHSIIQYSSTGTKLQEYITGFYPNAVIF